MHRRLHAGRKASLMPQHCTMLCPVDDPQQIILLVRGLLKDGTELRVQGDELNWLTIELTDAAATLTFNRRIRQHPGDPFSKMVLGMHTFFNRVQTSAEGIKKDVLHRVANMALAVGVVGEPGFVEAAGHYDCIFGVAGALGAVIWTGNGVISADGTLLLDGRGASEVT